MDLAYLRTFTEFHIYVGGLCHAESMTSILLLIPAFSKLDSLKGEVFNFWYYQYPRAVRGRLLYCISDISRVQTLEFSAIMGMLYHYSWWIF